jgi:type IV secretory pathway VirD2 relaxase
LGVVSVSVHNTRQAAEARAQLAAERAKQQAFYRRMEQVITAVDGPNQWTSFKEFFPTTKLADDGE